jgi:phosphatidylinositol alpha 1,6-mannosyltransferase
MESLEMTRRAVRVALFPDSYHEVNGVANTTRRFEAYAREQNLPMLLVAGSEQTRTVVEGSIKRLELQRGPFSFGLDRDLRFDVAFLRHHSTIKEALLTFKPDVVHVTGPSDVGIAGVTIAHELGIPLAASWHTNLHEYAARRTALLLNAGETIVNNVERASFAVTARMYKIARVLFAPNQELMHQISAATGKPCFLMSRGVDTQAFNPGHRIRQDDGEVVIGYCGRLTTEKSVRDFAEFAKALLKAGITNFRFVFVGQGSEDQWLAQNVPNATLAGVRKGLALSQEYANFDVFAFPSKTDTFGNVVLEALASGVPAVVTSAGGPKFIVQDGATGFIASNNTEFATRLIELVRDTAMRKRMGGAAREAALSTSWHSVFSDVYETYERELKLELSVNSAIEIPA